MSLLVRKRTVLAKIESSYGVDPTPTGAANAILIKNLNVTPLNANLVSRDIIRGFLGNSQQLIAEQYNSIDFEVELCGAIVVGSAPAYGPLLKACGFAQTLNTSAISITRSGATATATLAAHGLTSGSTVRIAGASQTEYNGDFPISNITTNTFDFTVTGTPATPATGSPVLSTTAVYAPVSSSFDSVTLYMNVDGVRQKFTGARGNVEFTVNVKQIPVMKFSFIGIYNAPTDTGVPTCDFSGFNVPKIPNTTNTTVFSLLSYSGYLESMRFNMANDVQYRTLVGSESVLLVDRKPEGTFQIEMPTIAAKDFFTAAINATLGAMTLTHGIVSGNKVTLGAPYVSLANPSYQESQGIQMLSIPFIANPSSSGNDEFTLTVF